MDTCNAQSATAGRTLLVQISHMICHLTDMSLDRTLWDLTYCLEVVGALGPHISLY